jgi:branched-chain amino acid aminotransferase
MRHDAGLLHVPFPPDAAGLKHSLLRLVHANEAFDASLRVVVVRNHGGLWEGPGISTDYDLIALTATVTAWGDSVRLGVVPNARHAGSPFAGTKLISWAYNLTWYEQAHLDGYDEVVLLNERSEVAECTSANIFAAFGDRVWTPPLSSGCLPGITREVLLKEVKAPGFHIEERTLRLEDLAAADQVFITSTTRELLPVTYIDGISVRNESRACETLENAFSDYIDSYVAAEKKAAEPAYSK